MGKSNEVKETEYEKELAKVYGEEWAYYQESIVPFENQVIDEAKQANDANVYDDIAENTNLGYKKSFSEGTNNALSSMEANGINPNSGKFKNVVSDMADNEASVTSDAKSRSQVAGQERYTGKMSNVMAMGQGQSQEATATLSDIASSSQQKAFNDANNSRQQSDSILGAAGAVAGAAGSYYKNLPPPKPDAVINSNAATPSDVNKSLMGGG
ncbi:hypothetical protein [Pseudoalteromonas sp. MelDa3]|uniref:hypothetical protein n=1 Tax=Pseudoalteromonas sp. MelDa3 TaxID=888435 RepID=UPI000CC2077E|nr:hypothetical protein [Pseudoalteromonas sp. MelDa3]PLT26679.1 hypothetical protein CXF89_03745 [Pseudoalteromonas sp. MelDa3]